MKEELKVLFYLKKNQVKANGLCSVMGRITIGRSMAQFSAKIEAEPSKWDAKAGRMTGKSNHALQVNHQIDKINLSINARYKEYLTNRGERNSRRTEKRISRHCHHTGNPTESICGTQRGLR